MADDQPILARLADGRVLRFPAGTPDDVVDRVVKKESFQTDQSAGGYITNLGRGFAQGADLNFMDEISAAADAALGGVLRDTKIPETLGAAPGSFSHAPDFSKRYSENLDYQRARDQAFMASNPVSAIGSQIAGGVASLFTPVGRVFAPFQAARGTSLGAHIAAGAKSGGTVGAAAGFGAGEGDLGNRVESAAIGAGVGTGVGAAAPAVAQGVGTAVRGFRRAFDSGSADDLATAAIRRKVPDPAAFEAEAQRLGADGTPVMPVNAGSEDLRMLGKMVTSTPGPGRDFAQQALREQQAGQAGRVMTALDENLGAKGGGYYENVDDLIAQRSKDARPLYEKAFSYKTQTGPIQEGVGIDPRIQEIIKSPEGNAGLQHGLKVQRVEALAEDQPFNPHDYGITGYDASGNAVIGAVPNMRALDAVKRGFDQMLEAYRDKVTGKLVLDEYGRAIDKLRRAYVSRLDDLNPDYAAARQAFAGPSQSKDAMALGRAALSTDSDITARTIAKMPAADQEFFREGVRRAAKDIVEGTPDGADVLKRLMGNQKIRDRLAAAFPEGPTLGRFLDTAAREKQLYSTAQASNAMKGSQTTPLAEAISDFRQNDVVEPARQLLQGQPVRATMSMLAQALQKRAAGVTDKTSESLAKKLFSTSAEDRAKLIAALERQAKERQQVDYQNIVRSRLVAPAAIESTQ